jgi:DHA1 family multidrug resistance protein-like MFS transporter
MGIIGAAMGVGMVLGPGLGGGLASRSLSLPFFVAAGLSVLALAFILLVLPESLPKEERAQRTGDVSPLGEFKALWADLFRDMWQGLTGPIGLLLALAFLLSFGLTNFEGIFGLYAMERYGYGPDRVGILLTAIGLTSAVVQGALTGPLTRRWGEATLIRASLLGSAVGFVLMLQAQSFVAVLLTVSFFVLSNAMLRPAVSSLISKRAAGSQGVAMGLNNSFMSLGRIAGPTWAGFVLDVNLAYPYTSGALIMLAGFLATILWLKPARKQAVAQGAAVEPEAAP